MLTNEQIQDKLNNICVQAIVLHEEATKLMKELGQVSGPLPSRGRKKKGPMSQEQINKILANRMRSIKN
jgi:hypothetical protein